MAIGTGMFVVLFFVMMLVVILNRVSKIRYEVKKNKGTIPERNREIPPQARVIQG